MSGSPSRIAETSPGAVATSPRAAGGVGPGDLLGERYRIEVGVGRGASGSVFRAFDRVVEAPIAIKILRPDLAADAAWVHRLVSELRHARKLQHPNVCRLFDIGEADGHRFLTMEFASGGSLRAWVGPEGAGRPLAERVADARAVIDGLAAIHAAGLIHRDVKPENVLRMQDGRLVVSDFGLAVDPTQATALSGFVGTPSYMAPEVALGGRASAASDVFSLGVLLHEILFCHRPEWEGSDRRRRLRRPPLDRRASRVERALARLCVDCLDDASAVRPRDACEVQRRFERAVTGRYRGTVRRAAVIGWGLTVAAVLAVGLAFVLGGRSRGLQLAPLSGVARDARGLSRLLVAAPRKIHCASLLPGGRRARLVWGRPASAAELDLATGEVASAALVPEAYKLECPQTSPDGRILLYTDLADPRTQRTRIMMSDRPDGGQARFLTEGAMPRWLPSGSEFVYKGDARRAAVYSMTGRAVFLPDSRPFERFVVDLASNARGDRIAVVYARTDGGNFVEIHDHPSPGEPRRLALRESARSIAFDPKRDRFLVTLDDPARQILAELRETGRLERRAGAGDANLAGALRAETGLLLWTLRLTSRVIVSDGRGGQREVARDGFSPVASARGDALWETKLGDGRRVIAHQRASVDGVRIVSPGPWDVQPAFGPDGTSFLYVRAGDNTVVRCGLGEDGQAGRCRDLHADPLKPHAPALSPDGRLLAYQTSPLVTTRVRVVSVDGGEVHDLGAHRAPCRTHWASERTLWVFAPDGGRWSEIDALTARPTGRSAPVEGSGRCPDPPGSKGLPRAHVRTSEEAEVRIAAEL